MLLCVFFYFYVLFGYMIHRFPCLRYIFWNCIHYFWLMLVLDLLILNFSMLVLHRMLLDLLVFNKVRLIFLFNTFICGLLLLYVGFMLLDAFMLYHVRFGVI